MGPGDAIRVCGAPGDSEWEQGGTRRCHPSLRGDRPAGHQSVSPAATAPPPQAELARPGPGPGAVGSESPNQPPQRIGATLPTRSRAECPPAEPRASCTPPQHGTRALCAPHAAWGAARTAASLRRTLWIHCARHGQQRARRIGSDGACRYRAAPRHTLPNGHAVLGALPAHPSVLPPPPPNLPSFRLEEDRRELGGGECGLGRHDSDRLRHGSHWKGFDNEVGAGWGIRVGGCGGPGGKGVVTASYRSARCSPRCRRRRWNRRAQGHQGLRGCRMPEHGGDGRRRRPVRHGNVDG
jgi:hypothetical protein